MVYQCEKCEAALPAGVVVCPKCGDTFDEAVPQDAEVPRRGWKAKPEATDAASETAKSVPTPAIPEPVDRYPDYILPDGRTFTSSAQSFQEPTVNSSPALQNLLAYAGITALVIGIATIIYYLNFFSVTVTTPHVSILGQSIGGGEVNNVGLLSDRQNGLIIGISVGLLGAILFIASIFVDLRAGAKNLRTGSLFTYALVLSGVLAIGSYSVRTAKHQSAVKIDMRRANDNLKVIGLGIMQFAQDNDENLPPMNDISSLQNALKPYVPSEQNFLNPVTSRSFTPNNQCSGLSLASIADASSLIVLYDEVSEPDGSRLVLYADGHTRNRKAEEWAKIIANKKPNKPYDSSDTSYASNDTLIPPIRSDLSGN